MIGDYAERTDLPAEFNADIIQDLCNSPEEIEDRIKFYDKKGDVDKAERLARSKLEPYSDITDDLIPLLEEICELKYEGDGWRNIRNLAPHHVPGSFNSHRICPDMIITVPQKQHN